MIQLERDEKTGALLTPMVKTLDAKAREMADKAGSVTSEPLWPQALVILRQSADFQKLIDSHLRLGLADGDARKQGGMYYQSCTPEERAALDSLWRKDTAAAPPPVTLFSYNSFEATIERTLTEKFNGDRAKYSEALHEAARLHPDRLQVYLRGSLP